MPAEMFEESNGKSNAEPNRKPNRSIKCLENRLLDFLPGDLRGNFQQVRFAVVQLFELQVTRVLLIQSSSVPLATCKSGPYYKNFRTYFRITCEISKWLVLLSANTLIESPTAYHCSLRRLFVHQFRQFYSLDCHSTNIWRKPRSRQIVWQSSSC